MTILLTQKNELKKVAENVLSDFCRFLHIPCHSIKYGRRTFAVHLIINLFNCVPWMETWTTFIYSYELYFWNAKINYALITFAHANIGSHSRNSNVFTIAYLYMTGASMHCRSGWRLPLSKSNAAAQFSCFLLVLFAPKWITYTCVSR